MAQFLCRASVPSKSIPDAIAPGIFTVRVLALSQVAGLLHPRHRPVLKAVVKATHRDYHLRLKVRRRRDGGGLPSHDSPLSKLKISNVNCDLAPKVLNTADFELPQHRRRAYLVGCQHLSFFGVEDSILVGYCALRWA